MLLIDTNVAVSLWIENDWSGAARQLLQRDPEWCTEAYLLVELSNVMATYVRARLATRMQVLKCMAEAEALFAPRLQAAAHRDTLTTALAFGISACDARFLVVATQLGVKLVTEDAKLRRAAPRLTQSIRQALAGC